MNNREGEYMYTPIDDQTTIDAKIHHFIERKAPQGPLAALKSTIAQWRMTDSDAKKTAKTDIAYETLDWSQHSYSRSGFRKLAH